MISVLSEREQFIAWAAAKRLSGELICPIPSQLVFLLEELSKDDPGFTLRFAVSLKVPAEAVYPRFIGWMLETICLPLATGKKDWDYINKIILLFHSGDWRDKEKASAAYTAASAASATYAAREDTYAKMRSYLLSMEPLP